MRETIHLLEKYLSDPLEPIEERMTNLRHLASLLEAMDLLPEVDADPPRWQRPLWVFPVRFLLEQPFTPRKRIRQKLTDPHHLVSNASMLKFHERQYTTEISADVELKRLPSRAMLTLEMYKFPRDLPLDVSLNGLLLPRCVMRVDWRGRGDDPKSRHHLELLPGVLQIGTNRVVVRRGDDTGGRSLDETNVVEISLDYDP
jgi:hypothetical protein